MTAFNAHTGDKSLKCIARIFVLRTDLYGDHFGSQDIDVIVVSDPTDSTVIGWFMHID